MKHNLSIILIIAAVLLAGCPQPPGQIVDRPRCPGKASLQEALESIRLQKQNVRPFRATAECVISYVDSKGKDQNHRVSGNFIFVPPDKIFFKGDVMLSEVRFGTNETEFWLRVKPDMDTYWWGSKSQADLCRAELLVNPANIAEALGVVDIDENWQMFHREGYDIFSLYQKNKIAKRAYINACDYTIEQIEYFDADEFVRISVELNNYTTGEDGIVVPSRIRVCSYNPEGLEEVAMSFKLNNIRYLPPEKQGKKLFVRPGRDGYEHLLRLTEDCEFIEEVDQ